MVKDLELVKQITWSALDEIVKGLKQHYGQKLLSVFVTGSTFHNVYTMNQDVDLLFIVDEIAEENLEEMELELKRAWEGSLVGYKPFVPDPIEQLFQGIKKKYDSIDVEIVYKFVIAAFFPEPIKKITINFHTISPMSLQSMQLYGDVFSFHLLTMIHNCKVLFGEDPKKLVKIFPSKNDLEIWINTEEKRINKNVYQLKDSDPHRALYILTKEIVKIANEALVMLGIYHNQGEIVAKTFEEKIPIELKSIPVQAYYYKVHSNEIIHDKEKFEQFLKDTHLFISQVKRHFNIH